MKDYSRFITGFITGYTIEKDKIIVNIPNSKGIIPTYDATPENIQRFKNRLENQYQILIKNQDKIITYEKNRQDYIYTALVAPLIATLILLIIIFGKCLLTTITSLSVATIVILGKVVIKRNIDKLKKEINIYHKFMTNMPKIEETYLKDKNLTQNLSPKATSCINNNVHRKNEYKEEDYLHTDYIFDINLMDSLSLQDLHQLLLNNQIITSLNDNQVFSIPNIKVKTLKPTKNNHSTEK